jgi:hypothetical protein
MPRKSPIDLPKPSAVDLWRLAKLREAAHLAGCSVDYLRDHHADKIVKLGPRMQRMRVGVALAIGEAKAS